MGACIFIEFITNSVFFYWHNISLQYLALMGLLKDQIYCLLYLVIFTKYMKCYSHIVLNLFLYLSSMNKPIICFGNMHILLHCFELFVVIINACIVSNFIVYICRLSVNARSYLWFCESLQRWYAMWIGRAARIQSRS